MSTLIVHPRDPSTFFLKAIYAPIPNKTIITGGINKTELRKLIETHDRVIMLGHGSPWGLMSVGQFSYGGNYIIDLTMGDLLIVKKDNIYIWCNADQFVKGNQLSGFFSGMFVSEISEGNFYDFWELEQQTIDESNHGFAGIVSRYINEPLDVLYKNVLRDYRVLSETNPIAQFNLERLYFNEMKPTKHQYTINNSASECVFSKTIVL
jgi:hypothetical protein